MRTRWGTIVCAIAAAVPLEISAVATAQDTTITNLAQLADMAFSANHSLYLPWMPWQWRAYSTDNGEPWWIDCSQVACADLLSTSTNSCATLQVHGVTVTSVVLTKNVLTGETLLGSGCSTNVIASIDAPSGYQSGMQLGENAWVWRQWQQFTNNPDAWGIEGDLPPLTITLKARLADANDYSAYQSNLEAAAGTTASGDDGDGEFTALAGSGMMGMDNISCTITDEMSAFGITDIEMETNGCALTWPSCSDHLYVVQAESSLTPTSSWTDVAWMWGDNGATTWTDTNAVGQVQEFYRVVRASPDQLNNGVPYGWAVDYGLDPLDPNLAHEDLDNDFWSNLGEYLNGTDPILPADALLLSFTINGGNTVVSNTQVEIELATGIIADYTIISEDSDFTSSVTNLFSPVFDYTLQNTQNGMHTLYLQLFKTNGTTSPVFSATAELDTMPPSISITSPTNGTIVSRHRVNIEGFAADTSPTNAPQLDAGRWLQVTVNGEFVNNHDTNGNWWAGPEDLAPGTNIFVATATDRAGWTATNAVSFIYDPTLATNVPNFTLDVTNAVTVGSNATTIAVSGTIDDGNATVQIDLLDAVDPTITNASISAAVNGTNWWADVPVVDGSNVVVVSAANSASAPSTNSFLVIQNAHVFLQITSPAADTDANATNVLVVGQASTNFDHTITINGVPALTSTGPGGITFSNTVPLNSINANVVEVDATGTDGSSAIMRQIVYGYELLSFHIQEDGTGTFPGGWYVSTTTCVWDPTHGNRYHLHDVVDNANGGFTDDGDPAFSLTCGSSHAGDICLDFSFYPRWAFEGDYYSWSGPWWGPGVNWESWDSQFTVIKHAPDDEEQLVVFHFTGFQYSSGSYDGIVFDPSTITFRGSPGFWYIGSSGQTNGIAFLIKIHTNTPFTIKASDFVFPAIPEMAAEDVSHEVFFSGFGNAKPDVTIKKQGTSGAPTDGLIVKTGDTLEIQLKDGSSLSNDLSWYYQQLKSDGTWTSWTDFGSQGHEYKFEYTTASGGIFSVKAAYSSNGKQTDFIYTRQRDERKKPGGQYGNGKKGAPDAVGVADTQMQIDIRNKAKAFLSSFQYSYPEIVPAAYGFPEFGTNTLKCNIFVAHMAVAAGAVVPKINGFSFEYPPLANQWAGTQDTDQSELGVQTTIDNWTLLPSNANPQPGYIIAHPESGDSGHCGITDYDGQGIGAGTYMLTVHKLYNFYEDGTSRMRRYEP
ncbi:MAG TPA: hypothetical protein VNL17_08105 [Verrucomicrobiae bacterium]|nr:hypothetical protein [Verrucomicrobiae bacterium]